MDYSRFYYPLVNVDIFCGNYGVSVIPFQYRQYTPDRYIPRSVTPEYYSPEENLQQSSRNRYLISSEEQYLDEQDYTRFRPYPQRYYTRPMPQENLAYYPYRAPMVNVQARFQPQAQYQSNTRNEYERLIIPIIRISMEETVYRSANNFATATDNTTQQSEDAYRSKSPTNPDTTNSEKTTVENTYNQRNPLISGNIPEHAYIPDVDEEVGNAAPVLSTVTSCCRLRNQNEILNPPGNTSKSPIISINEDETDVETISLSENESEVNDDSDCEALTIVIP